MLLAKAALEDGVHRENTRKAKFSDTEICEIVGIHKSSYKKWWYPKFREMQNLLQPLAAQALGPVYAKIQEIAESEFKTLDGFEALQ